MNQLLARIEIQLLMDLTAKSFEQKSLRVWTHPYQQALATYAACTRDWMQCTTKEPSALQADMHCHALRMGRLLRKLTFFLNEKGHARLVFALYKGISIDMHGTLPGTIQVTCCYFSQYYTPGMCALISAMDDGMVSGVMGGGSLTFNQRITEGCGCCQACLTRSAHDDK